MDQTLDLTSTAGKTKEVAMGKARKRKKISGADLAFRICNGIFMICFVIITLYPVLNTLAVSLNDGTDALNTRITAKHFWKTLNHSLGNQTMLLLTITSKLAPATFGVGHDELHLFEHTLTSGREFVDAVSMGHHLKWRIVASATIDITRPVTAVMRDVERLLALRRRCQIVRHAVGIGIIVARGISRFLDDEVSHRLSLRRYKSKKVKK